MKGPKKFDCVEMKDSIQGRLRKKHRGLSQDAIARQRQEWLNRSDAPLAKWWRSLSKGTLLTSECERLAAIR